MQECVRFTQISGGGGGGGFVVPDIIGVRSPRIQITNGFYRLDHGHAGIKSCSCTIPLYPSSLYNPAFPSKISSQKSKACRISRLNISFQVYRIADTSISFANASRLLFSRFPLVPRIVGAKSFPPLSFRFRNSRLLGHWFEPSWKAARHTNAEPILTFVSASSQPKFGKDNELRQSRKPTQPLTM